MTQFGPRGLGNIRRALGATGLAATPRPDDGRSAAGRAWPGLQPESPRRVSAGSRVAPLLIALVLKFWGRRRKSVRRLFAYLARPTNALLRAPSCGGRILSDLSRRSTEQPNGLITRARLTLLEIALGAAVQINLGAGDKEAALTAARLANLIFRRHVRRREGIVSRVYFQTLLLCAWHSRIARECRTRENINSYLLNLIFGTAHVYLLRKSLALHFLGRAVELGGKQNTSALRMLGRAHLIADDQSSAIECFRRAAQAEPHSVMAHQNYAARYDTSVYIPPAWELADAGRLNVYDNLIRLGEEFYRLGSVKPMLRFYGQALAWQNELRASYPLPLELRSRVAAECPQFDTTLPIRLLGYEWVTQIGHIGFLDHYLRVALLYRTRANFVLLAPSHKVVNGPMLDYWRNHFCIVRNEKLVDDLLPYQRMVGDQFIATLNSQSHVVPWADLAAQAQWQWAEDRRPPLISLSDEDRLHGMAELNKVGIGPQDWYVGIHVREGGYYGDGQGTIAEHRSARIDDYKAAIEEITRQGGWVIRLGDSSMTKLPDMPRVIDYAHSKIKSSRLDVFLFATSRFVIGTTSGPTNAVQAFGTPMLITNAISNDSQPWTENTRFMLKKIFDKRQKKYLRLDEIYRAPIRSALINNELLRRLGLESHANTPEELRAATKEMLTGTSNPPDTPYEVEYRDAVRSNPYLFGAAKPTQSFSLNFEQQLQS